MSLKLRKYSVFNLLIIAFFFLTLGLILYSVFDKKIEIFVGVIASGISLLIGFIQYILQQDRLFKELFTDFNTKYDEKFNDKLNIIEKKYVENENYILDEQEELLINDYLNICAEEYLWYRKNRIDEKVWISWRKGMVFYLNLPPINRIVLKEVPQKDSYYGLFNEIGSDILK